MAPSMALLTRLIFVDIPHCVVIELRRVLLLRFSKLSIPGNFVALSRLLVWLIWSNIPLSVFCCTVSAHAL